MTAITRPFLVTGMASVRTGTPLVQSGSLSRQMRRSSRATSSRRWSSTAADVPTTSSWNEVGPVVGRIWASAIQPFSPIRPMSLIRAHKIRSANDRSASSCQSETSECSHSTSASSRLVWLLARSFKVGTQPSSHSNLPWHYVEVSVSEQETSRRPAASEQGSTALDRLRAAARVRAAAGLERALWSRDPGFDGLLDLASNDYLGLCGDPRLAAAASAAAAKWGTGATGSRLVTGNTTLHGRLEERLASFTGAAGALVFSSGYLANLTAVTAVSAALGSVLIVSDERNHASLIDACRLARSPSVRLAIAPHGDVAAVRALLSAREEESALVVSDAVFSVDGSLAPIAELHATVREYGALLILDEAHALGV